MRAVIQRVSEARVKVDAQTLGEIGSGLLILLGVEKEDRPQDGAYLAAKIAALRLFEDAQGKMNLSLSAIGGSALVVSQFTLLADCRKGRRPGFSNAAPPELAKSLYENFIRQLEAAGITTETGRFQAEMQVELVNNGPVTLLLDSRKTF